MGMQVVCCVCHRCKLYNGWHRTLVAGNNAELSHGYCPDCFRTAMLRFGLDPEAVGESSSEASFGTVRRLGLDMVVMAAKDE